MGSPSLARFSAVTSDWFESAFAEPTPAQNDAWEAISTGEDVLVVAPTGSGKTLAAFLWALDRLAGAAPRSVETVLVDEVHPVAATKRGSHLALSLERLDELLPQPAQRIGLSATVRPLDEVARFLSGGRPVKVVAPPTHKELDLSVVVPVEDMTAPEPSLDHIHRQPDGPEESKSIWPHVERRLVELVLAHRSTIVFTNSRLMSERICARMNEIAERQIARAHHGSVSREQRLLTEEDLKAGRLPCVVATSSLELGIDMGAVDLVIQVEAPTSVAQGMQRIGRGGHPVGAVSL